MTLYDTVMLFGPPGVGKGAIGKMLNNSEKYFSFSIGDMFRSIDGNTDMSKIVQPYISNGDLVPDDLTLRLLDRAILTNIDSGQYNPKTQFLLLDGIPRIASQVDLINQRVEVHRIINLYASNEILESRIERRANNHGREDDMDIDIARKRLKLFGEQTLPLLEQYNPKIILNIDSTGPIEEVHRAIFEEFKQNPISLFY